jgi:tetratricopeptide (TPR) repeat protein
MLVDWGAEQMRHRYAKFATDAADKPTAEWYAGYAALVAGDRHTQDGRRIEADNAYTDAVDRFARSAAGNSDYADSSNHYAVFALAGRAMVRHQRGDSAAAVEDLLRAAALRPDSLDLDDALQRKPRGIALRIRGELEGAGRAALAARLAPLLP